jgi:hypothetical protein
VDAIDELLGRDAAVGEVLQQPGGVRVVGRIASQPALELHRAGEVAVAGGDDPLGDEAAA